MLFRAGLHLPPGSTLFFLWGVILLIWQQGGQIGSTTERTTEVKLPFFSYLRRLKVSSWLDTDFFFRKVRFEQYKSGEERNFEIEKEGRGYKHVERTYGGFRRDLNLPSDIDADKIDVVCTDGFLTLTLPKGEKAKPIKVKVKSQ
jgi:hypothetical protein